MLLCVLGRWGEAGPEPLAARLLEAGVTPRVAVMAGLAEAEGGEAAGSRVWLDARGLSVERMARRAGRQAKSSGVSVEGMGTAMVMVAAYAAAWVSARSGGGLASVLRGKERNYLADQPLWVLEPPEKLVDLLAGIGVETCGALAALPREAVEVRFGGEAVEVWRRARAEDRRVPFGGRAAALPSASLDFIDYVVTDPERLAFVANALLENVCEGLSSRGMHARRLVLSLPLANGQTWRRTLRPARPTASRSVWLRRVRQELERLTVPDAVAGVAIAVESTEAAASVQGDLFDPGFATAASVESALERLLEGQGAVVLRPESNLHVLAERRSVLTPLDAEAVLKGAGEEASPEVGGAAESGLTLQLLAEPRRLLVETVERRDHTVPVRYHDGGWRAVVTAMGPERVSGGQWEEPFAREYYRLVAADGALVWVFREARSDVWYLHGWWD